MIRRRNLPEPRVLDAAALRHAMACLPWRVTERWCVSMGHAALLRGAARNSFIRPPLHTPPSSIHIPLLCVTHRAIDFEFFLI